MKLEQLLEGVPFTLVQGSLDTEVQDIIYDSRKAAPGLAFVCIVGTQRDSHEFAADCAAKGVSALVIQHDIDLSAMPDVTVVKVENSRYAMALMSCNLFGNPNALPGMIVVGSFTVPLSTMIMFMEVNAWRNISLYKVIQTFLVGGCASLVATLMLFSIVGSHELNLIGAIVTGIVEEAGKAVIVFWFLSKMKRLSILGGLLIGASVGAGFAAFESAGYALQPVLAFFQNSGYYAAYGRQLDASMMMDAINQSIIIRGFLAPGGHVTWAAISGAALVIAGKALRRFDTSLLTDKRFLRLFIIPVILHAAWDSPMSNIGSSIYLVPIALTVIVWIVVMILINMGLAEVERVTKRQ